ncbi:hypothetical protein D0C36_04930 [Mucilaginibacter conchicola]|uniref:DUF6850 domain-containing protein n=1 Tax=Mucilaginibacter conchicola TaxID=2303333 RepID=A0A372NYY7_9SPHI|nr:DUF6850 family outer membrane beta-barrel protein [Mucilaginibacter conchicola]RFZ94879.1 hypothetical protein D0C36_04930 [Mucilaginibacter conchicola]
MRYLIILIFITLPGAVFAQIQPDSVLLFEQGKRSVDFAGQNATQLLSALYRSLSSNALSYDTQSGHFRTSQQAESNNAIHFGTSGIQTLGRFKMRGSFDFTRMTEDSLGNVMKGLSTDVTPFYYMAAKPGQYRRLNYTLTGLLSYELLKDKLYIASGIDYLYNNTTRSVDPRPSIQTFKMLLKPEVVYHAGNHFIGIGTDIGYGNEDLSVGFKNSQYSTGNMYPDRILYLVRGYGYSDRPDERRFKREYSFGGYHVNYAAQLNKWQLGANFSYASDTEKNLLPLSKSENDLLFATFNLNTYKVKTLLAYSGRYKHQFFADAAWQNGYDENVNLGGTNYRYHTTSVNAGYSFIKSQSNFELVPEFGINVGYQQISHRDISGGVSSLQSYLQPGLSVALYKKYHNYSRASFKLQPSLRLPQQRDLSITTGLYQYFTDNIAAPDHVYFSTSALFLNTEVSYLTPHLFKGINSGIRLNTTYARPLKNYAYDYQGTFKPGGHRLFTSLSLIIYF